MKSSKMRRHETIDGHGVSTYQCTNINGKFDDVGSQMGHEFKLGFAPHKGLLVSQHGKFE